MRQIKRLLIGRMNVRKTSGPLELLKKTHQGQSLKAFLARKEALDSNGHQFLFVKKVRVSSILEH